MSRAVPYTVQPVLDSSYCPFEILDKHVLQLPTVTIRSFLLYVPLIKREPATMEECNLRLKLFASLRDVMCASLGSGSHS